MSAFKGDYLGFTYNGKHSSVLGIVRTSNGSRFDESLLPTMQDKTVQVPGGDGVYYFGSYYTSRPFVINFAFDSLTEEQISTLKRVFGDKKIHDLIFDERPYKAYRAKVTGSATIKYIPFSEGDTNRIYKGEGTIQFTCYEPFARCILTAEDKEEDLISKYANYQEWKESARIDWSRNFGDIEAPFKLTIKGKGSISTNNGTIAWVLDENEKAILNTKIGIAINEANEIVNNKLTGDLTMKIPINAKIPKPQETENNLIIINGEATLEYDRYYF